MKAELVPDNGDPPIPITRDVTVIGRKEYCDVVINHESLSKRHCVVVKTDGLLVIRDLATTNGTKVKGQRIRWAALLPDDRITFGGYKLRVYLGPDDQPGPSERVGAAKTGRKAPAQAQAPPKKAPPAPVTRSKPAAGFPSPAPLPLGVPSLDPDSSGGLEILEDDDSSDDDSGWRKLISSRRDGNEDDVIIELD